MLLSVRITVAYAASNQRWSPHVLKRSNITTTLQVILRLYTISSLLQGFRAPAFEPLSQTHSVLCDLLSLAPDTQIQDLSLQRQCLLHHVFVFKNASVEQRRVAKLKCLHLVLDRIHIQPSQPKVLGPQVPKTLLKNCLVQTLQDRKKENPFGGTCLKNILNINLTFF